MIIITDLGYLVVDDIKLKQSITSKEKINPYFFHTNAMHATEFDNYEQCVQAVRCARSCGCNILKYNVIK